MSIKLNAQSGGSVALDAPTQTTGSADNLYKLPVADGSAGQILTTDGSGNLSWKTPSKILQVLNLTKTDSFSTTSTSFVDITGFTLSITPTRSDSKIFVLASAYIASQGNNHGAYLKFYRVVSGASDVEIGRAYNQKATVQSQTGGAVVIQTLDSPGTTASVTYKGQLKTDSGSYNARIGAGGNGGDGDIPDSVITLMEVAA